MGFNSVYRVLQELFPEVDTRLLRAVAIENSKDSDLAAEVVLTEIIPYLSKGTTASGSSNYTVEDASPGCEADPLQVDSTYLDLDDSTETLDGSLYSASLGKHSNVEVGFDVTSHVTPINMVLGNGAAENCNSLNTKSEEINSLQESSSLKVGSDHDSVVSSTTLEQGCTNMIMSDNELADRPYSCRSDMVMDGESHREQSPLDGNHLELENSVVQLAPSSMEDCIQDAPEDDCLQVAVVHPLNSECEDPESSCASDDASKKDLSSGAMADFEDESALNSVVTRSGQVCRIDLLEDIIEDARNNKKTLFSAMESVISLMREVEFQEKAAELAREEAVRGDLDILVRVEDLKQMLQHAKEANSMHAGEVYGEKAILATEVRELQSRLLSLSDERDKSLAILDEMRQTIEERLDAAEKERKAAEQEKAEKEESARNALAEQELIMEKVVQESKMLKQEAEENSKLQEFLMDRGRVVDTLQGEISVICQDVKLLKEKFDERVPLSKSLSSSQTSCLLASSSSSLKSMSPDLVPEQAETPKETSPAPSVDDQLSSGGEERGGDEKDGDDRKALAEDGWEFFDNREIDM